ncbi:SpoIIE family protein phosphatase [Leadbettera azotonutricia]|nr:SpoIIE family protein phosphatase [Leadbettera azotonutricia]
MNERIDNSLNELCTDVGFVNVNKHGEQLCGDHVEVIPDDKLTVMVLADGLGSGVKANILSTLTSKIISTMIANSLPIEECVNTIASTLPLCKERQIAYSTFTIVRISNNMEAEIIQYDNPWVILLRNGKNFDYPKTAEFVADKGEAIFSKGVINKKVIYKTKIRLQENDTFIAMSDGAIHAGIGKSLNFGWQRDDIIKYMEEIYQSDYSAKTTSSLLLSKCVELYGGEPGDDTTISTVKIRRRRPINLLIGPPANPQDVMKMMALFFAKEGKHIVCGGTTSTLAAEFLRKSLNTGLPNYVDPDIPPTAAIDGVDLVTEGVITMSRVLEYARDYLKDNDDYFHWKTSEDGASQIAQLLFEEATDINFYVGRAMNAAHQNPDLPIGFSIKMHIIDELSTCLKAMGKQIKVSYF